MTFTLPTNEEKASYVHSQFERIAKRYDLTNDVISFGMHRLWKARAVDILLNNSGDENEKIFLDLCCGTGDLALRIAKKINHTDQVCGVDFSSNMLEIAKSRTPKENSESQKMRWIQGDAQNLPFNDDMFNGAIISFGLRNLTDLDKGLEEMHRVVKPGRPVINLDLGRPEGVVFAPLFKSFFRYIVPHIGALVQGDRSAYTYLPESMSTYPDPEDISNRFEKAGLTGVKHLALAGGSVALHYGFVS